MTKKLPTKEQIIEFLRESNAIEREFSKEALEDAGKAWLFLVDQLEHGKLMTPQTIILETHRLLGRRIMPAIAGKFRDCAVYIGGREAPPWRAIPELLENWIIEFWDAQTWPRIKKAHIEFEHIHPFVDGNGRTGRLIMNYQRLKAKLPLKIIHTGKEQFSYYDWFKN